MLEQKLYTVADVAEVTGLTSRTIRNYLKDGTLRGRKIGVQWRFTEADINRLFTEVKTESVKALYPGDVISDFMDNTVRSQTEGCLVIDFPYEKEEELQRYIQKLESYTYEVLEDSKILRVAATGDATTIEKLAARMKEF